MKHHNPFLFLAVVIAVLWLATFTRASDPGQDADARVRIALALASLAKPGPDPFAETNKAAKTRIPACKCGCMETGQCKCKNCCERTADPTWKANPCLLPVCDCGCELGEPCRCYLPNPAKKVVSELQKSYAKQWQAEGWAWNEEGGYWSKPSEPVQIQQAYQQPIQQFYQPQPQFVPMQQFGGFGGGMRGGSSCGPGGCR